MVSQSKNNQDQVLSKIAVNEEHGEDSSYFLGWKAYEKDQNPFFHPYHEINQNSNGVIQMGLAENQLCFDLIEEWIKRNPDAAICTNDGIKSIFRALFQDYHGLQEFRQAVARFMEKTRGGRVRFDSNLVLTAGATSANETIIFCTANPGDAFLVPTPYYAAFDRDLKWRTGAEILPICHESSNNFKITSKAKEAYENAQSKYKAKKLDLNVKGLLMTNPSNPLGTTTLDRDTLKKISTFTNQKGIHLVCDEIYAATVFSPKFVSIADILLDDHVNQDLVHIVYSLSKDLGLPGFRVGIVYSKDEMVVSAATKMSSFGLVCFANMDDSSQTQLMIAALLSDKNFTEEFLIESSDRLRKYEMITEGLKSAGINCLQGNAGLFVWMDLRQLLKDNTFDSETELWNAILHEVKLNISPGSSCHSECSEPGWFRCFANMDIDETLDLDLGVKRLKDFAQRGRVDNSTMTTTKQPFKLPLKKTVRSNLRPAHSPMNSPLVRART
uniref:1-aminocyclopropane-1-carboxylate synthase n=1 Tax=Stellaria longipes TaxID=19744 RepID=O22334_STELP|nr:ACC synthase [Stellaria longipes]